MVTIYILCKVIIMKALKIPTYSILANVEILAVFSLCPPEIIYVRL